MKELLKQNGYVLGENPNEWVKGNWTIRLDEDYIEAFEDLSEPEKDKYTIWPSDIKSLTFLLEEIEKL